MNILDASRLHLPEDLLTGRRTRLTSQMYYRLSKCTSFTPKYTIQAWMPCLYVLRVPEVYIQIQD